MPKLIIIALILFAGITGLWYLGLLDTLVSMLTWVKDKAMFVYEYFTKTGIPPPQIPNVSNLTQEIPSSQMTIQL